MRYFVFVLGILLLFSCQVHAEDVFEVVGLEKGIMAPDFKSVNYEGEEVSLSSYVEKGPVVLVFYRGGWCHYCNLQLQKFQQNLEQITDFGASVIALSVDKTEKAQEFVEEKSLDFEVLSDPQADVLEQYNLVFYVPEELAKIYKEDYQIDLEAASGRTDHLIAIPATYVIDGSGKIVFASANKDYKIRPDIKEVIGILKGLAEETEE